MNANKPINPISYIEKTDNWILFYNKIKIKKDISKERISEINTNIFSNFDSPSLLIWNNKIIVSEDDRFKIYPI